MPLPPGTQHAYAGSFTPCCAHDGAWRAMWALWHPAKGTRKKGGAVSRKRPPRWSGQYYFFFAFLAFLAAFFAFLAIVPPEGVQLVPDGDSGSGALSDSFILSASQAVV